MPEAARSWGHHARYWHEAEVDALVVRYEDLLNDTSGTLGEVLGWLGRDIGQGEIEAAVEATRLDRMRNKANKDLGRRFFRQGKSGRGIDRFRPDQIRYIVNEPSDIATALGLRPPGHSPRQAHRGEQIMIQAQTQASADSFPLVGTEVSAVDIDAAVAFVAERIATREKTHICVASVNMLLQAREDPKLRQALATAGLVVPDGYPLTRVGQMRAEANVGRVRGTDFTRALCAQASDAGHEVFFYGGAPGVPEAMADQLQARYPDLEVAGTHSPPFRPLTDEEDEEEVAMINAAEPDIVFVGIGCPKQERWMVDHRDRLEAPVLLGVGAAFDFIAGNKREAPRPIQRVGLEWLWRFGSEPRRLWPRVLVEGPKFLGLLTLEMLRGPEPTSPMPPA